MMRSSLNQDDGAINESKSFEVISGKASTLYGDENDDDEMMIRFVSSQSYSFLECV